MNLALAGIVILILVSPGILFRRLYYTGEFSKQFFKSSFVEQIYPSMAASAALHFLLLCFSYHLTNYRVDISAIGMLISGTNNADHLKSEFAKIESNLQPILWYHAVIFLLSGLLGYLTKFSVRKLALDRLFKWLRFKNEWHYYMTGECLDFENVPDDSEEIDFTYVDALIDTKDGTIIYSGILNDYVLSNEHGLDRLFLSDVRRRLLINDSAEEPEANTVTEEGASNWYPVKGEIMAIPFEHVINLNFTYYTIETPTP